MSNFTKPIEPVELSVCELFGKDGDTYTIPIYQRNYAWGSSEIRQLIQDVFDYSQKNGNPKYYIGSLVVYKRPNDGRYETIDGQQRLTTLLILLSAIQNNEISNAKLPNGFDLRLNLAFESRERSTATLEALHNNASLPVDYNVEINNAYQSICGHLKSVIDDSGAVPSDAPQKFVNYLCGPVTNPRDQVANPRGRVVILRVEVPADTDLNHYFEIMNNRGEQLEQHEIVKAKFLERLQHDKGAQYVFTRIWDACADMNRYLQENFPSKEEKAIFGAECNALVATDIQKLTECLKPADSAAHEGQETGDGHMRLKDILSGNTNKFAKNTEQPLEKFESVVNFKNFLLHVLRLHRASLPNQQSDVALDDKRLLVAFDVAFDEYLKGLEPNDTGAILKFAYDLLRCRFLLDNYIIKRVAGKSELMLKSYKRSGDSAYLVNAFGDEEGQGDTSTNKQICMLLSMFHVASPAQSYKHWLSGALNYLYHAPTIDANGYAEYLERLAHTFLYDRSLATKSIPYFDIIYKHKGKAQNTTPDLNLSKLNAGTSVPHFVFYYLDYLLWKENRGKEGTKQYEEFRFVGRDSVEHWLPQNPLSKSQDKEASNHLHDFGNLCLINSGENSRLSNHSPKDKANHLYGSSDDGKIGSNSFKQWKMVELTRDSKGWGADQIKKHSEEMKEILKRART